MQKKILSVTYVITCLLCVLFGAIILGGVSKYSKPHFSVDVYDYHNENGGITLYVFDAGTKYNIKEAKLQIRFETDSGWQTDDITVNGTYSLVDYKAPDGGTMRPSYGISVTEVKSLKLDNVLDTVTGSLLTAIGAVGIICATVPKIFGAIKEHKEYSSWRKHIADEGGEENK